MEMKEETSEYYFSLEERKKLARKNALTLGFPFTLALLALYGLIFYPFDVMSTMSWIFGSYRSPLLISFSTILLLLFSIFIGLFLTVYLWKYISIKKIMKEFNR
jgi:ABC-type Mn2+/Zn2+ transport system permease subunit